jgi:hypothetical protein
MRGDGLLEDTRTTSERHASAQEKYTSLSSGHAPAFAQVLRKETCPEPGILDSHNFFIPQYKQPCMF